jgi:hypothetical protein
MASESHTMVSPSLRQGTLPLGEMTRNASQAGASPKASSRSWNSICRSRISTQGRSDHEE